MLYLIPNEQLTRNRWSRAPSVIRRFVEAKGLRGTHFFLLWHGIGYLGYDELAVDPETRSSTMPTLPIPDPWDRRCVDGLTIDFSGYGDRVSSMAMRDCIANASRDVGRHFLTLMDPMTAAVSSYSYSEGGVTLSLTAPFVVHVGGGAHLFRLSVYSSSKLHLISLI